MVEDEIEIQLECDNNSIPSIFQILGNKTLEQLCDEIEDCHHDHHHQQTPDHGVHPDDHQHQCS